MNEMERETLDKAPPRIKMQGSPRQTPSNSNLLPAMNPAMTTDGHWLESSSQGAPERLESTS